MSNKTAKKWNGIGSPDFLLLDQACALVNMALDGQCYLVGSALERRDYRDVDVRIIFDDVKYDALFGGLLAIRHSPLWSLMCASISTLLSKQTGLKVDFQIQRRSWISEVDWAKDREPVGLYSNECGPAWWKAGEVEDAIRRSLPAIEEARNRGIRQDLETLGWRMADSVHIEGEEGLTGS